MVRVSPEIQSEKDELRSYLKTLGRASSSEGHDGSPGFSALKQFLKKTQGIWGAFVALSSEPSVAETCQEMNHLQWAFPRIEGDAMEFRNVADPTREENFEKISFGIWQPKKEFPVVEKKQLAGVLVPGLAFDRKGGRIGRGKGHYDRFLADLSLIKIGVLFSQRLLEKIPRDGFDITMDYIVTEKEMIATR